MNSWRLTGLDLDALTGVMTSGAAVSGSQVVISCSLNFGRPSLSAGGSIVVCACVEGWLR